LCTICTATQPSFTHHSPPLMRVNKPEPNLRLHQTRSLLKLTCNNAPIMAQWRSITRAHSEHHHRFAHLHFAATCNSSVHAPAAAQPWKPRQPDTTQQPCRKTSLQQKPWWRKEEGGRNPSFGERKFIATYHPVIA